MGYYSQVALVIRKDHEAAMKADPEIAQLLLVADEKLDSDDALLFHWGCIKWYPDFKDVGALMALLFNLDDGYDYYFVRLGEEDTDMEVRGDWYDNPFGMGYSRRIDFDRYSEPAQASLKDLNTRPDTIDCAKCGTRLKDPVPGMPSMKHCPVCEP